MQRLLLGGRRERSDHRDLVAGQQLAGLRGRQPAAGVMAGQEAGDQFTGRRGAQPVELGDRALLAAAPGLVAGRVTERAGGILGVGVGRHSGEYGGIGHRGGGGGSAALAVRRGDGRQQPDALGLPELDGGQGLADSRCGHRGGQVGRWPSARSRPARRLRRRRRPPAPGRPGTPRRSRAAVVSTGPATAAPAGSRPRSRRRVAAPIRATASPLSAHASAASTPAPPAFDTTATRLPAGQRLAGQ